MTGIVAEEEVPKAVKYAGSMVKMALKGLTRPTAPATKYCVSKNDYFRIRTMTTT